MKITIGTMRPMSREAAIGQEIVTKTLYDLLMERREVAVQEKAEIKASLKSKNLEIWLLDRLIALECGSR